MALHPQAAAFLEDLKRQKMPTIETLPIDLTRRALLLGSAMQAEPPVLATIENREIPRADGTSLPIRIYVPAGAAPIGTCLYFHGGGWVLNSIDTHDDLVRRLTAASGCVFVNVEYRLAPEHKYPAAVEDAYLAVRWVQDHAHEWGCDSRKVAVSGDSAGGNLAAAACLMVRDRQAPSIAAQALIYPITDCDFDRPSYLANGEGYFLTRREMKWFWNHYVSSPEQMREPYASPLLAPSLRDLPPALILTAEYDPLRDEGEAYAEALRQAGVDVTFKRYDGMIHAFMKRVQYFDAAFDAIREVAQMLQKTFNGSENSRR